MPAASDRKWPRVSGPFFEDLQVGDVIRSRLGRTVTDADNLWFTCLTMNTNQIHFNRPYAEGSRFGRVLVNSTFTLALVTGLSIPDTSENAVANLSWDQVRLPNPVFVGDTIWAESEILERRESQSNLGVGIVKLRTRGINQDRRVVIEFLRTFMLPKRGEAQTDGTFPGTQAPWSVP